MGTATVAPAAITPTRFDTNPAFDAAYLAAQPLAVQAMLSMTDRSKRFAAAIALAQQGFAICGEVVAGEDPWRVMAWLSYYGYTWIPSILQAPLTNFPGGGTAGNPSVPAYNPNVMPAGAIKVSINIADYPPYAPVQPGPVSSSLWPAPTGVVLNGSMFELQWLAWGPGVLYVGPQDTVPIDQTVTIAGLQYVKTLVETPFANMLIYKAQ